METIVKIKSFYFPKLNNLEYGYFAHAYLSLLKETTAEKLHIDQRYIDRYAEYEGRLSDLSQQSRVANETAQIAEIDKLADDIVMSLFDTMNAGKKSPIATRKAAATELYNALKPYSTCYRLPQRQEVQALRGLLVDVAKENLAAHVTTLGMDDIIEALAETVEQYASILEQRAVNQEKNSLGSAKELRVIMDQLFDYTSTIAFAFSIAAPSAELDHFVKTTNRLINDANKAYNLRTGTSKEEEDEPIIPIPDLDEPVTPEITSIYHIEGNDTKTPLLFERNEPIGVKYQGFTLKGADGTLEHVIGLVNENESFTEWIKPEAIRNVTENGCEFTMVEDLAGGKFTFRIETYDGGSPLVVEYPEMITLD